MRSPHTRAAGFSLLELMTGLTILGVLLGVGVPAFNNLIRGQRISTQTNEFVGALAYARIEASTRGVPVSLCAANSIERIVCDTGTNWTNGWIIFTDRGANVGEIDLGEEVLQTGGPPANTFNLQTDASFARFGFGNAQTTGRVFTLSAVTPAVCATTGIRRITVDVTGRTSTAKDTCPQ